MVCYPFVVSVVLPFECIDEIDNGDKEPIIQHNIVPVRMTFKDYRHAGLKGELQCALSTFDCTEKDKPGKFIITGDS